MNWSEFKDAVRVHLHAYNRTHGAQTLIEALIKGGVEDLQSAVRSLRVRTSLSPASDVTAAGEAGLIALPVGSFVTDLYATSQDDPSIIRRYTQVQLEAVTDIQAGNLSAEARVYAYNAAAGQLWMYPIPAEEAADFHLTYSAISADYGASDTVPFGNGEVECVGQYCLARLTQQIDRDLNLAASHFQLFKGLKRQVMSDRNEAQVSIP